jgi:ABC transporter, permease protein
MSDRPRKGMHKQSRLLPAHIVLTLGGLTMVFPFIWQVLMSLSTNAEIQAVPPQFLPASPQWGNYAEVLARIPFLSQFWTSFLITALRTGAQLILCSMAGYAFARMQFKGRNVLFGLLLAILMIPSQAFLITQYQIIKGLNLLETPWGIVLPGLFSAFGTFLMRQAFMSLPKELEEAARLDGCNPWQVFWKVMFPLVKPSLFAVAITTVLWSWNDLLWPLIVTTRESNMPLSAGIATFAGQHTSDWNLMMAASAMAMAPIFVLFFAMQRKVIEGLATSGLKG